MVDTTCLMSSNNNFIRDESPPRSRQPRAPFERERPFTRSQAAARRSLDISEDTKEMKVTEILHGSPKDEEKDIHLGSRGPEPRIVHNKTPPVAHLDEPHRADVALASSLRSSTPPDDGLSTGQSYVNARAHDMREQGSLLNRDKKQRIAFPGSQDKRWNDIEQELQVALPLVFTNAKFRLQTTSELATSFDDWLYAFFAEKFGLVEVAHPSSNKRKKRPQGNRQLAALRRRKKMLKKQRLQLLNRGLRNSPEFKEVSQKFYQTMRQHNGLRKALGQRARSSASVTAATQV